MDTTRQWAQAREIFLDLLELPEDRREAELQRATADDPALATYVRELLRHDRALPETVDAGPDTPGRFGPYEVIRSIGRGGMGEVFMARRADGEYEREVAIKLLRADASSQELVRRFLRERQTLARLDHEYIAKLLDGGTTPTGEPYLVMEYVEGEPADQYAARLGLRERLQLFIRIGQAVSHAHERGFVHRDLKPGNVLVRADGTPRLLDFGIARPGPDTDHGEATERLTRTGHRLFTPEYASPEQIRGEEVTVQSDVFSLGVLLYLFLCGHEPWSDTRNLHELERKICDEDPPRPSRQVRGTTRSRISGDLDAVVSQCLAKRPERRYASVADLCADLERHLAGLPIHARRTGALGRALRFARRKPAYPVGAGLLLIALAATFVALDSERRGERRRAELSAAVTDRIKAAQLRWNDGDLESAAAELDAAAQAVKELPDERELAAEVLVQKAVLANLRREWPVALELCEQAQVLLDASTRPTPTLVATMLNTRSYAMTREAPGADSKEASRVALEHARATLEPGHVLRVDALLNWSDELRLGAGLSAALGPMAEAVDETRQRDPRGETLSRLLNDQAVVLAGLGRFDESVDCYREALDILKWHRGEKNPAFAKVRLNLGTVLFREGRYEEALEEHEQSLAVCREYPDMETFAASNLHFLGRIHYELYDLEEAEAAAREALEIRERNDFGIHVDRSRCLVGIILARADHLEEAREILEPLLERLEAGMLLPEMEADAQHYLGAMLQDAGEAEQGLPHLVRALELKRGLLGPSHEDCLELVERLERED